MRNNRTGKLVGAITADGVYKLVRAYSALLGFEIGAHALRATAATNALDHEADIAKVQEWLGHANIATTRIYDHRRTRPEDSLERSRWRRIDSPEPIYETGVSSTTAAFYGDRKMQRRRCKLKGKS